MVYKMLRNISLDFNKLEYIFLNLVKKLKYLLIILPPKQYIFATSVSLALMLFLCFNWHIYGVKPYSILTFCVAV